MINLKQSCVITLQLIKLWRVSNGACNLLGITNITLTQQATAIFQSLILFIAKAKKLQCVHICYIPEKIHCLI